MVGDSAIFGVQEAERYLLSLELFGMRFGLDRMRRLMTVLGCPHERFGSVHVVGTNGKSSTTRMIAAVLGRHGLLTGAYVSPHLSSFAERIEVGETPVSGERLGAAVGRAADAAERVNRTLSAPDRVTQFEALTAAAYWELGRSKVDVAVVEAGLGGRYDATSVIRSDVQVLTNIGLEHTRWLGPTERHIAEEKLAVVPSSGRLVAGPLEGEALWVAERIARDRRATLVRAGRDFGLEGESHRSFTVHGVSGTYGGVVLRPLGLFQRVNFTVAVAAAETFLGGPVEEEAVRDAARGLALRGRLEVVGCDPLTIYDSAHNPAGIRALVDSLAELTTGRGLVAVISVLDDKDAAGMLADLLPLCERVVFTRSSHRNALPAATLESLCRQLSGPPAEVVSEPGAALELALGLAGVDGAVLATGSSYVVSDLVRHRAAAARRVA